MRKVLIGGGAFLGLLIMTLTGYAETLNFTFTLVTPTCDVTASGLGAGNTLAFGSLPTQAVNQDPTGSYLKTFTLNLTNCTGAVVGVTPKFTPSGTTIGSENKLFNDGTGTNKSTAGFIVRINSNTVTWSTANTKDTAVGIASIGNAPPGSVNVAVGVSRGSNATPADGTLSAKVTFTFAYQ